MDRLLANLTALDKRAAAQAGISTATLMDNAGQAIASAILAKGFSPKTAGVILCGPGNNGGDGFVTARLLLQAGYHHVTVVYTAAQYRGEALENLEQLLSRAVAVINATAQEYAALEAIDEATFLVDALFGNGLSRPVAGLEAKLMERVQERQKLNASKPFWVLAVDVPSGIDAATGQILGSAIEADETVTFALSKPGLYLQPAKTLAGKLVVADIGLPERLLEEDDTDIRLMGFSKAKQWLAPHPAWGHKNTFGHVAVLAGSAAMPGAAVLCSESAMCAGPGLVTLSAPQSVFNQMTLMPEIMRHATPDSSHWTPQGMRNLLDDWLASKTIHAVAMGPGLGREQESIEAIRIALEHFKADEKAPPVVLDADGLFALAQLKLTLNERFVITPHVGECAHLLDIKASKVSADLLAVARLLRQRFQCQVVLKSSTTVVALLGKDLKTSEGCWISPWGNSGMATAGSGDVLTGILSAQLAQAFAQQRPIQWAITLGVALHGLAGDSAAERNTVYACHASDIRRALPEAFKQLQ